jgi:hypothetical protein
MYFMTRTDVAQGNPSQNTKVGRSVGHTYFPLTPMIRRVRDSVTINHFHDVYLAVGRPACSVVRHHPVSWPHSLGVRPLAAVLRAGGVLPVALAPVAAVALRRRLLVGAACARQRVCRGRAARTAHTHRSGGAPVRCRGLTPGQLGSHTGACEAAPADLPAALDSTARVVVLASLLPLRAQDEMTALEVHIVACALAVSHARVSPPEVDAPRRLVEFRPAELVCPDLPPALPGAEAAADSGGGLLGEEQS